MKSLFLFFVGLSLYAQQIAPSTPRTVVSDVMRDFSGQVLVGDIALSLNDPQYTFNRRIAVLAGTFSVSLYPGTYSVTIHSLTFNCDRTETWSVPNSGTPVTLLTVGSSSANISNSGNLVAHNLLSASHGDTTGSAAVRGGAIFAVGATPAWAQVAHSSASGGYFKWNGTDIVASTGAAAGAGSCTDQVVTGENADAAPTCATITSAYVDSSIVTTSSGTATRATNLAGGTVGQIPYVSAANTTAFVAANTAATDQVLVSHGTGSAGLAPTLTNAPALSAANMTNLPSAGGSDIPAFAACTATGCPPEESFNRWFVSATASVTWDECGFSLTTSPTVQSVIVDIQTAAGVSIFGATKLVIPVGGTATVFQATFANSPQTAAKGAQFKAVVAQSDTGGAALGGYVKCRVH